jgi:U-box domain
MAGISSAHVQRRSAVTQEVHLYVQAEEEAAEATAQPSKAAAKRARKKAARQRAAAASPAEDLGGTAAQHPANEAAGSDQPLSSSCSSTLVTESAPRAAAAELQTSACGRHDTAGDANLLLPHSAAKATGATAESDWWRCPLSGNGMRDPVLCGGEGHSFERAALEHWMATNPGVDPVSRQPLPPGAGNVVPNHALRSLLAQHLHLTSAHSTS